MIQICAVETEHGCICYQLERKNVRNINLRIRTDASVYVSAPKDVSESVVTQFVKRRSRYIAEAQQQFREFRQYAPQPRHYVSGESFSVLGRSLRLRVEQGKKDDIRSDGVYLYLTVKDTENQEQKQRLVDRYLNKVCREIADSGSALSDISKIRCAISTNPYSIDGYSLGILSSAEGYHYIEPALARNARQLY